MVEVFDRGATPPSPERQAGVQGESGRGLILVGMLADSWGIRLTPDRAGKSVWFQLRIDDRTA